MRCEAAEHWGDIKSDFVPLGIPLMAPESFDELFGVLPDSTILGERGEKRECHFTSSQTPLWETAKHVSNASWIIHAEGWTLHSLSLSKTQSVFCCSVITIMLNTELYWMDYIKCGYPVRLGAFMINNWKTRAHKSIKWCVSVCFCLYLYYIHWEREGRTETVFIWSEWRKCDLDKWTSRVSDS